MPLTAQERSELGRKAALAKHAIHGASNQYTTGKRDRTDPLQRAKTRAEFAAKTLTAYIRKPGKNPLEPGQVAACKVLIDKGLPSLSSIEMVEIDPRDRIPEAEILAKLNAIISGNPALLDKLVAMRQSTQDGNTLTVTEAEIDVSSCKESVGASHQSFT